MIKFILRFSPGCLLFLFVVLSIKTSEAQGNPPVALSITDSAFELKNNDRVVFLGNSLFENDLQFNYLETALTTRWPNRDITFRNLGWSGDMVRGEARGSFTNPPTPYQELIQQITKASPTIVFVAYGGVEALQEEAGLAHFVQGLDLLLDTIEGLGAKAILLSPAPVLSGLSPDTLAKRNAMLDLYASAIAKKAADRGCRFIDILNPVREASKKEKLTDNGFHLNETGYYYLSSVIESGLGLATATLSVTINVSKNGAEAAPPVKIIEAEKNYGNLKFKIEENNLPLPLPESGGEVSTNKKIFRISGLKKGFYTLTNNDVLVITASDKEWAEGVDIRRGVVFDQAKQLRELVFKKNDVFFHQYRPLNTTYIIGFRSYEQGRHVQELAEMDIIIKWLEGQISVNRQPKSSVYQLIKLKS